jgi:ADP-ribosylglycohydrolase
LEDPVTNRLLDRIQGCLLGAQIGDAMGMPWEGMEPLAIQGHTLCAGVTGFTAPGEHSLPFLRQLKAGDTTDDWALTAANARALIRGKGDPLIKLIVDEHLRAFHRSTIGWGRTTKRAMDDIDTFLVSKGALGRDPCHLPARDPDHPNSGCGNGVAMKIAPFAIVHVLGHGSNDIFRLITEVMLHGQLTHPDPRAWVAAAGIAVMVARQLASPEEGPHAKSVIPEFGLLNEVRDLLQSFEGEIERQWGKSGDTFTGRLERILKCEANLLDASNPQLTAGDVAFILGGNGYHALESCTFAIAMALRHPTDFRSAILNTVNTGGDADTNASMVGAMVGARVGLSGIPEEWREFSPAFQESLELADRLYALK